MHDDKAKKIGSAMYLRKSSELYIPFSIFMNNTDCNLIQPMLDKIFQRITYLDKDSNK